MIRGQITVEYLIILVVMVLLFTGISMDLSNFSLSNAMQVQTDELIHSANYSLISYAETLQVQGSGASRMVSIRAPADCVFQVQPNVLISLCKIGSFSAQGNFDGVHFADISGFTGISYSCPSCVGGVNISAGDVQVVSVSKA